MKVFSIIMQRLNNAICNGRIVNNTHTYGHFIRRRLLSSSSHSVISNGHDEVLPVLIVGAGPVGLVLSLLLTKLGIKCAVVEKNKAFSNHPQAHFINNRSMEVFRKLDGLAEEIEKFQPPVDLWRKFVYCTSLTGSILGSVDHMQPQDFEQIVSPVSVAHFSQYKLTRLLLKQLENFKFKKLTWEEMKSLNGIVMERVILMGHECISLDATDRFINVTASFLKEGKYVERNIRCSILVGTDGAGSTVRNIVGLGMKGDRDLQKLVSVHFLSRDLGQYLSNERPGMLFFIFNSEAIGVLVAHDLKQGEFVLQIPFYPPQQILEDFSHEVCKNLIFKLVGRELVDIDVIDIKPWVMHAEVAEKFVSCDNRIILAGDAAHRFPPAGGFGMNTGIQDAHNLAWKLASVVNGIAPSSLLCTYETERRPIAIFNTALSVKNFIAAMEVPAALGLDPTVANMVHRVINDGFGSVLPSGLQRAILDGIFTVGRAQLSDLLLNEKNPLGSSRLAKLRSIFEEGKSLQLQFPAEDLGFRYLEGALVPDGDSSLDAHEAPSGRRRDYVASADPGSRLPHMNVRMMSNKEDIVSTLDLVSGEKVEFLLIIAPLKESYDLARTAFKVAKQFKVSARVCVMWPAGTADGVEFGSKAALAPWENYIDVVEVKRSSASLSWWGICQMSDKGAILVRPDEHIGWRVKAAVIGDPNLEMEKVEYYFSDLNLATADHLMRFINKDPEGYAIILGLNANPVFAKDELSELHSENEAGGADVTGFRKIEDGSVISNVHTSKWRIFTDNGRDLFLQGKLEVAKNSFLSTLQEAKEGFGERDPYVASSCNNLHILPLSVVLSFKKINALVSSTSQLATISRDSTKLESTLHEVSEDGKKVGRQHPLTESDMEELQTRIVVAENLLLSSKSYEGFIRSWETIRTCQPQPTNARASSASRSTKVDGMPFSNKVKEVCKRASKARANKSSPQPNEPLS